MVDGWKAKTQGALQVVLSAYLKKFSIIRLDAVDSRKLPEFGGESLPGIFFDMVREGFR